MECRIGETQPRTCCCDSTPVCVAVDRLRPCTSAELLAFHYTLTKSFTPLSPNAQTQQGFIDERNSLNIQTIAGPSRTVDGYHEDENVRADTNDERGKAKGGRNSKRVPGTIAHNRSATCEFITI